MHVHWYHVVRDTRVHLYKQCRCGKRKIDRVGGGHQPIDRGWLASGEWTPRPTRPPVRPSDR